jgi:hypothetical protein
MATTGRNQTATATATATLAQADVWADQSMTAVVRWREVL